MLKGLKIIKNSNNYLENSNTLLYFNKMNNMLNKYPDGTGESDVFNTSKPIDTGLVTNLESELLTKDLNRRSSAKAEGQCSLYLE